MFSNKASVCQYHSSRGYCTVLKIDLSACPEKCAFFSIKNENNESSHILEDCRLLQHKGLLTICCGKGDIISSCMGCSDYETLDNYFPTFYD